MAVVAIWPVMAAMLTIEVFSLLFMGSGFPRATEQAARLSCNLGRGRPGLVTQRLRRWRNTVIDCTVPPTSRQAATLDSLPGCRLNGMSSPVAGADPSGVALSLHGRSIQARRHAATQRAVRQTAAAGGASAGSPKLQLSVVTVNGSSRTKTGHRAV
jgi:hypothetical protein